jgi:flagellin-specific chaperone FliS
MFADTYSKNLERCVSSAERLEIVQTLCRVALGAIGSARRQLQHCGRTTEISRASAIVTELLLFAGRDSGGPLARKLVRVCPYVLERLTHASFEQSDPPLAEIVPLLYSLLGHREDSDSVSNFPGIHLLSADASAPSVHVPGPRA